MSSKDSTLTDIEIAPDLRIRVYNPDSKAVGYHFYRKVFGIWWLVYDCWDFEWRVQRWARLLLECVTKQKGEK